jgi:hypothetical protein
MAIEAEINAGSHTKATIQTSADRMESRTYRMRQKRTSTENSRARVVRRASMAGKADTSPSLVIEMPTRTTAGMRLRGLFPESVRKMASIMNRKRVTSG